MNQAGYIYKILRPQRKRLVLGLIALLGTMVVDLGSPLLIAFFIDTIVAQNRYDLLPTLIVTFLMLPIAAAAFTLLNDYTMALLGQRIIFQIRFDLYRKIHRLHCQFLKNITTGKLMERMRGDVAQLQTLLSTQIPKQIVLLLTGFLMMSVMVILSWKLTLLVFMGMCLFYFNYRLQMPRTQKVLRRSRHKMDKLSGLAQEKLSGLIVVKSVAYERRETRKFLHKNFTVLRTDDRFNVLLLHHGMVASLITWSTYAGVISIGTLMAIRGELTYGTVTALAAFTLRILKPATFLAEFINQIQHGRISLRRIFELMNAPKDLLEQKGDKPGKISGKVIFKNVSFRYNDDNPVLNDINIEVEPGQTVALVGKTGCGKTTIVNLLYRYYERNHGTITIDDHDIRSLDTKWYRKQLAMVPQDSIILDTTIAENIAYGRPEATCEQIESAARMVELGKLLDRLDDGINTKIGEKGIKLSMGEKQRLCIARAVLSDPAILILDEATSSLDSKNEASIQRSLKKLMKNRTCFVIAHRLSTIVNSDLIVVMRNGKIIESGNHDQLMKKSGGRYRRLYLTQTNTRKIKDSRNAERVL